jgi:hypothetical protein
VQGKRVDFGSDKSIRTRCELFYKSFLSRGTGHAIYSASSHRRTGILLRQATVIEVVIAREGRRR